MQKLHVFDDKVRRIICETEAELIEHMMKQPRHTLKLLKPKGGIFNMSEILKAYSITNKEEKAKFLKRIDHTQRSINKK